MILETVFNILLELLKVFIEMFDFSSFTLPDWGTQFSTLFIKCLSFFPFKVWSVLISNILFWVGVHFVWSIVEWIYIKIPGVS